MRDLHPKLGAGAWGRCKAVYVLALLVGQIDGPRTRAAALAGGLIALALTPVAPAGVPIVLAVAGAALALGVRR